jgi:hypothetical protein
LLHCIGWRSSTVPKLEQSPVCRVKLRAALRERSL